MASTTTKRTANGSGDSAASAASISATEPKKATRRRTGAGRNGKPPKPDPTFHASATGRIADDLGNALSDLSAALKMPVWTLINGANPRSQLDFNAFMAFLTQRQALVRDGHIALIIDSPGGLAEPAYKLARLLQRNDGFTAVIPRYAKSAATLLILGAQDVVMGDDAEIGPLDAQLYDEERERRTSALDTVMALGTLQTAALEQLDEAMIVMRMGVAKRSDVLLPHAIQLVSNTMVPLLEKIDTVELARQSRQLKIAEEYAKRLIEPIRGLRAARNVAEALVNAYPDHSFVIDRNEACAANLVCPVDCNAATVEALSRVELQLWKNESEVLGRLEVKS